MTNPIQTNPTQAQANQLSLGIAVSQTAYALNNGGGLRVGQPLVKIEDTSMVGIEGARPLNIDIPPGYIVRGIYKDTKTGLDVFMAFDESSKKVVIGVAGTNGLFKDKPDTAEDLSGTGVRHMEQLFDLKQFKDDFKAITDSINGVGNLSQVLWAGQSLGGAEAQIGGALSIQGNSANSLGLSPNQVSVVAINSPGSDYGLKLLGLNQAQIDSYYTGAGIQSTVSYNMFTGEADKVSYSGGGRGGVIWGMQVVEAQTTAELHRIAFAVSETNDLVGGDLTQLSSFSLTPWTHESISSNMFKLYGLVPVDNNNVSMTWAGLTSLMLSKPGEPTALTTQALTEVGVPKVIAGALGFVGEIVLRAPLANPVGLVKALTGGYVAGRVVGSEAALEPVFEPVPEGYTRTNLTPPDTDAYAAGWRIVFDQNETTGSRILRYPNGTTQEYTARNDIIYRQPGAGLAAISQSGEGVLYVEGKNPTTGETTLAPVRITSDMTLTQIPGGGWDVERPLSDGKIEKTLYSGNKVTSYQGSYDDKMNFKIDSWNQGLIPATGIGFDRDVTSVPTGMEQAPTFDLTAAGTRSGLDGGSLSWNGDGTTGTLTKLIDAKSVVFDFSFGNVDLNADIPNFFKLTGIESIAGQAVLNDAMVNATFSAGNFTMADMLSTGTEGNTAALRWNQVHALVATGDATNPTGLPPVPTTGGKPWYESDGAQKLGGVLTSMQSLIASLKTGKPLAIANDAFSVLASASQNPGLKDITEPLGYANSLSNLAGALERGDDLAAFMSGASVVKQYAQSQASLALEALRARFPKQRPPAPRRRSPNRCSRTRPNCRPSWPRTRPSAAAPRGRRN
jgi:hypothetical protein